MRNYSAEGRKKYREGSQFEQLLDRACHRHGVNPLVFPMGGMYRGRTFVPVKTPFDRILIRPVNQIVFVDAKSKGNGTHFAKSDITEHQILNLFRCWEDGVIGGYIVWFREVNQVVFFTSQQLWFTFQTQKSLHVDDGLQLGPFESFDPSVIFKTYFK